MRLVFGFVLLLGVGLAGGAVYLAQGYVGQHRAALEQERAARGQMVPLVGVFVANRDLAYGEQILKKDVRIVAWPQDAVPEGTITDGAVFFPTGEQDLRTVVRRMDKDEAIMLSKVSEPGAGGGLTSRLSKGMRAFTIRVDATSGVSGFLRTDDNVDVYWTGRSGDKEVTKLIEAGVRIVAVDQTADSQRSKATIARTVTVEVAPREVAALTQAQATGRLTLSLVGANDDTVAAAIEIDQKELLGIKDEKVVEVREKRVCSIKTRKGAEVVEIPIPCTN